MLREIRVRNLALIEDERVTFGPGLNVVTGTTGAGKSLLLRALKLLLGGRFARDLLRTGTERLEIEAVFELGDPALIAAVHEALGEDDVPDAPFELVLRRRVDAAGRNRCQADGRLVPVAALRTIGERLVEVHGQSEHQRLLDPSEQARLLDRWAGLADDHAAYVERLGAWRKATERARRAARGVEDRLRRIEVLEAIAEEVGALGVTPGEQEELRRERTLLADAERHADAVRAGIEGLRGTDDDGAIDVLGRAARVLGDTADLSDSVGEALAALDDAIARADDAARELEHAADAIRVDPERLEEIQERLEDLGALLRRHGPSEEDALRAADEAAAELIDLREESADQGSLAAKVEQAAAGLLDAGLALNGKRREAAVRFCDAVLAGLATLGMEGSRFAIDVDDGSDDADLTERATETGLGTLTFVASPNPGEELRALARIASGGELARVALAIKGELAGADRVPLLVFDEVDADVGPRLGGVIGGKLRALSQGRQVLVVTHLPQVAAFGDTHVLVEKQTTDGRTMTRAAPLTGAARELEIAEMLRGEGRGGEALDQAQALLAEAAESGLGRL